MATTVFITVVVLRFVLPLFVPRFRATRREAEGVQIIRESLRRERLVASR